jgi:hypothetical protein
LWRAKEAVLPQLERFVRTGMVVVLASKKTMKVEFNEAT